MPSTYTLTLLSEQANSGPYYVVTYTTASIYGPVQAGSPAYLPDVGSTADVTIQENTASYLAFKLTLLMMRLSCRGGGSVFPVVLHAAVDDMLMSSAREITPSTPTFLDAMVVFLVVEQVMFLLANSRWMQQVYQR